VSAGADPDCNIVSIGAALRRVVLRLIDSETDPTERKARIMIAYQYGHLSADEVEDWLSAGGLVEA
jgi:hypothetical protein